MASFMTRVEEEFLQRGILLEQIEHHGQQLMSMPPGLTGRAEEKELFNQKEEQLLKRQEDGLAELVREIKKKDKVLGKSEQEHADAEINHALMSVKLNRVYRELIDTKQQLRTNGIRLVEEGENLQRAREMVIGKNQTILEKSRMLSALEQELVATKRILADTKRELTTDLQKEKRNSANILQKSKDLERMKNEFKMKLEAASEENEELNTKLEAASEENEELNTHVSQYLTVIDNNQLVIQTKDEVLRRKEERLQAHDQELALLKRDQGVALKEMTEKDVKLKEKDVKLKDQDEKLIDQAENLKELEMVIARLQEQVNSQSQMPGDEHGDHM